MCWAKTTRKKESIPVGCVLPAFLIRGGGGLPTETHLDRDPADRDPTGQKPLPWTETPPPGQRPLNLDRDPQEGTWDQGQRPPKGTWDHPHGQND